ncbi:MAG: acyltransferase family protein [Candidatus Dojkabacteria bacterium]
MAIRKTFREGSDFANIIPKIEREAFIDIAKIVALLLMLVTHVIAITYDYTHSSDPIVYYIGLIGGIGSFTAFLFLSGINYYYSSVKEIERKSVDYTLLQKKLFYRTIQIGLIYVLLSVVYIFVFSKLYLGNFTSGSLLREIYNTFTLGPLPEFSEYLIAIAIFIFGGIIFGEVYKWISKTQWRALLSGTVLFFIGYISFNIISGPARLNTFISLLAGKTFQGLRVHSFPVFQYAIIFFLGLWFGHFVKNHLHSRTRFKATSLMTLFALILTIVCSIVYTQTPLNLLYPLPVEGRFPPSIGFLSLSFLITGIILLASLAFTKLINGRFQNIIKFFGSNTLGFLTWHLLILFLYKYLLDTSRISFQASNIFQIVILSIGLFAVSSLLTLAYNFIVYKIIEDKFKNEFYFLVHSILPLFVIAVTFVLSIFLVITRVSAYTKTINDDVSSFQKVIALPKQDPYWANDDYKYKRQLTISNTDSEVLFETNYISIDFDHAKSINEKKSLDPTGKDLRIIYWNKTTNTYEEIPISIVNPNTSSTQIIFKLSAPIAANAVSTDYYLYYGNIFAKDSELLQIPQGAEPLTEKEVVGDELQHRLSLGTNKEWFLIVPDTKKLIDNLSADITLPDGITQGKYYISYQILDSEDKIIESKEVPVQDSTKYSIAPDIEGLPPAIYKVQAKLINFDKNLEVLTTYKTPIKISYPLYVTWSFDWDGWGVSDFGLSEINYVANRYSMPIVQLFNPRIFVKDQTSFPQDVVTPERADYLTQWVKNRQTQYGDEIGMHLHMFADMVSEAGVTPRPGRVVGAMYGDAITSDFTQSELEKIMAWGFDKFKEHDLPKPITYRTGGWFSSPSVLAAAQNAGFLIDSSGRTGGRINPTLSYSTELPWTLQPTTTPYLPSVGDINKWEDPRLNIWEFPDNGADSYWFSAEDLITRFQQNMPGASGILTHPQVLTYLTHPHWFTIIDEPKVKTLFDYTSRYKYDANNGPVLYTTLEKAYNDWDRINDINGI